MKRRVTTIVLATLMCASMMTGCGKKSTSVDTSSNTATEVDELTGDDAEKVYETDTEDTEPELATPDLPHYDCKQEILDADPGDGLVQIADMVFRIQCTMDIEDVRKVVEASDTGLVCVDTVDEEDRPIIEIQDKSGNEAIRLVWVYCSGNDDISVPEPGMYLNSVNLVRYDRDWADYNSHYLAGGIPLNSSNFHESVDMSSFPYTRDEFIAKLESEGFTYKDNEFQYDPHLKYYVQPNNISLQVFYPSTFWMDRSIYTVNYIIYDFSWNKENKLAETRISCVGILDRDKYYETTYGEAQ